MHPYVKTISVLIPVLLLSAGPVANAQILDASVTSGIRLDSGMSSISTGATTSAATGEDSTSDTGIPVDTDSTPSFTFSQRNIDTSAQYSVTDADAVQTQASLESYAGSLVRDDERLEEAVLEGDTLTVKYRLDADFLGFIPSSIVATAIADATGTVTVVYPWYAFLMNTSESRSELETRLTKEQSGVNKKISGEGAEALNANASWALRLERLRQSLYAQSSDEARR
jgi:hypothetical protein